MAIRIVASMFLSAAVNTFMVSGTMANPDCNMLKIAEEHIAQKFPGFYPTSLKAVITERGRLWELTYELPFGVLGGVPVVTIDKSTCKIVRIEHTQ